MESLLDPVELNRETTQALDEIRSGVDNALYGAASADAEERIYRFVLPLIEDAGLPSVHVIHYRWFLRELARHWRTRKGRDLAFHLELCVRKWVHLGLEPRTLQFLICESHQRLKGVNLTTGSTETAKSGPGPTTTEQSVESAKSADVLSDTTPSATSASSAVVRETPPSASGRHSVSSAKSVDVLSGPGPDTGILESSTPGPLP